MYQDLVSKVEKYISGERIKKFVTKIYTHDRYFTFPEFHRSAKLCRDSFKESGLDNVKLEQFPADAKTKFYDYIMPIGWDAEDAELTIKLPSDKNIKIASYKEVPVSLFNYSAPTPTKGVTAQIVHVKDMKSLNNLDMKGKIVFIHECLSRKLAYTIHKMGGIGIIQDWRDFSRFGEEGIKWENYGFFPDNPFKLFGFSISREDGNFLAEKIDAGEEVFGHAKVKTKLYTDKIDLVAAEIKGKTDEEIIAFAHLFEYGAWDNAAGAAVIQEAALVINELIQNKVLAQPKRSIKFLHGFECYGLAAYLANHQDHDKIIAGINVDGVGIDMLKFNAPIMHFINPDSNPSFTDNLLDGIMGEILPMGCPQGDVLQTKSTGGPLDITNFPLTWKNVPFGGCDSLLADPCFSIPFPGIVQFNKDIWHNSMDTPDIMDPKVLQKITIIVASYLYYLSNASYSDISLLLQELTEWAEYTLKKYVRENIKTICSCLSCKSSLTKINDVYVRIKYLAQREKKRLRSINAIVPKENQQEFDRKLKNAIGKIDYTLNLQIWEFKNTITDYCKKHGIKNKGQQYYQETSPAEIKAMGMIPERKILGILTLETLPEEVRYDNKWGPKYQTLLSETMWIDGKRSIYAINQLLSQETGSSDINELMESFEFLEKYGYIKICRYKVPIVKKADVTKAMKKLGVKKGDTLMVHSSLSKLGHVKGGPDTIINGLLESVGNNGTVALPTFAYSFRERFPPFDRTTSPSNVGVISEYFRNRKESMRSPSPSHSVSAAGRNAKFITDVNDDLEPYDINGPFGRLVKLNAKIVFLGCTMGSNSTLHAMEDWHLSYLAPDTVYVKNHNGSQEDQVFLKMPTGHRDFYSDSLENPSKITRHLQKRNLIKKTTLGNGNVYMIESQKLNEACKDIFNSEPDVLLCDNQDCKFCATEKKKLERVME